MGNIAEAAKAVEDFFKKTLGKEKITVVKTSGVENGWEARVEVVEESESLKAIGKRVMEKHFFDVAMDKELNILSYDRHEKQ